MLLVIFSIIAQSIQKPDNNCDGRTELVIFMACLLMSTLISAISDVMIVWNGLKGSILQPSSRRFVESVMYVLTSNFLIKIGIIGYGTYLVYVQQPQCLADTSELDRLMQAVIISTWVIAILYLCLFVVSYQAFPKNSVLQWKRRIRCEAIQGGSLSEDVFVRCVNCCCCGGFDSNESAPLANMALVFERFFNPLDFSATDTLTSIVLASKRQSFLRQQHCPEYEALPVYMTPSNELTSGINGIQVIVDRSLESPVKQQIELQSRRLRTVSEDKEMDMEESSAMEEGNTSEEEGTSCRYAPFAPFPVNADDAYDQEVANIGPHHRRTNAIDFEFDLSNLDLEQLRYEDNDNVKNSEGSDHVHHGSISSPDTVPHADSIPSNSPSEPMPIPSPNGDLDGFVPDKLQDHQISGRSSAETTLSWGDEFSGPFLIPSSHRAEDVCLECPTVDYDTLDRMHLYHRYALASYGAVFYLASGKRMVDVLERGCGLCIKAAPPNSLHQLASARRQPASSPQRGASLIQRLNEEAVLRYGFKQDNILYRSHEDVLAGHLPYFVALDHGDKAVVVAVRGTWSWSDVVTDFLIHPEPLNEEEAVEVNGLLAELTGFNPDRASCLPNVSVHSGMLRSARGLIANLQSVGMLEFLETGSYEAAAASTGMTLPDIQDWKFVMTGHSLGAGVVSLATLLLKSR